MKEMIIVALVIIGVIVSAIYTYLFQQVYTERYGRRGFEGVQLIRIVPAPENYSREIFSASLITYNESVFWADDDLEEMDDDYSGSFVKALCLKWRKINRLRSICQTTICSRVLRG